MQIADVLQRFPLDQLQSFPGERALRYQAFAPLFEDFGTHTFSDNFAVTSPLTISSATVLFNAPQSFASLTLTGGTLGGSGDLTITGAMNWSGGTLTGTGKTSIGPNATLSTSGPNLLLSRNVENAGIVNHAGWGITFQGAAITFVNLADGVINVIGNGHFRYNSNGHTFKNFGTFNKSGPNGTTEIWMPFENSGTVNVSSGTLELRGGGGSSSPITIPAESTLKLLRDYSFAGLTVNGAVAFTSGVFSFSGELLMNDPLNIQTATLLFNAPQSFRNLILSGGTLGGNANVTVTESLNWSKGTMLGIGRTTIAAGAVSDLLTNNHKGLNRCHRSIQIDPPPVESN